ncbi:wax ester/triacylglycerol synthase domain-containing protein [Amycolatopsis alkalitolerans]|uniref:diacylglycerol O-acyltransferase n=1 Tax=Amycolatopsis alkalitolerans TaxID=2547244 RepID=A0A5C4M0G2_9PSEU|nr:wax ester/triacylglycerol synthase domain-containing protein [Amycolatopsis alkalitolerans]TNC26026.1 DUF1298 domain-containing protein [Amycolatopsis alkalitolerans]
MPTIERASPGDLAFLAMDSRTMPEQFGVLLSLDWAGFDLARARRLFAQRIPALPRLRQRLVRVPAGCGGPIWIDDTGFDLHQHVRAMPCEDLLSTALEVVATPLPRTAPLWSAVFLTGPGGEVGLVIVLHHALADGVGGLAVLAHLLDPGTAAPETPFPRPWPANRQLAAENLARAVARLRRSREFWRQLRAALSAGGGLWPPRAAPSALLRKTGPRRVLRAVRVEVEPLRKAAHRCGATVNDAVLVAVGGALHRVVSQPAFAIAVPVSGRPQGDGLGNVVTPMLIRVPGGGDLLWRLRQVAAQVRETKAAAAGPSLLALLGKAYRGLAALGGYRWYMNHQHRLHTLVSHVRGPAEPVFFGGHPVRSAVPIGIGEGGNVTVYFEVLSYAGCLTITVIADPDHFTEIDTVAAALRAELDAIARG